MTNTTIEFYRTGGEFGCFSNFAPYPIELNGKVWPTAEYYFQAQKYAGSPDEEEIRLEPSPMIAARMGRDRSLLRAELRLRSRSSDRSRG